MSDSWNIICFSGIDWGSHRRRSQWLMSCMADMGHRVLFVENLGTRLPRPADTARVFGRLARWARSSSSRAAEVHPGIRIDSPIVLPMQHIDLVRSSGASVLLRRLRRRVDIDRRPLVLWTDLPMPVIGDIKSALDADVLVYDWADDAPVHMRTPNRRQRERVGAWEDAMTERADLVIVASDEMLRRRGSRNPHTYVVHHGFAPGRPVASPLVPSIEGLPRPRIGFIGSLNEWLDQELVIGLARSRPDWSFVMVGPVESNVAGLKKEPNVHLMGSRPHSELPSVLGTFDAGIIPYRITPATETANPLKLREYIANGLPVVSVDIPAVRQFGPGVAVANDADGFGRALDSFLDGSRPSIDIKHLKTWEECASEIAGRIAETLERVSVVGAAPPSEPAFEGAGTASGGRRFLQRAAKATFLLPGLLDKRGPNDVVILIYHRVGKGSREIDLSVPAFRSHLEVLAARDDVMSLDDLLTDPSRGGVVITFDDGNDDFYEIALPLLAEHRVPATLYLTSGFVRTRDGGRDDWVSWDQLREAIATGLVTVGSHTHNHVNLLHATGAEARHEMVRSKETIEQELGRACEHFAYPLAVGSVIAQQHSRELFKSVALDAWRTNRADSIDLHRLGRIPVFRSDGEIFFKAKLAGCLDNEGLLYRAFRRGPWRYR